MDEYFRKIQNIISIELKSDRSEVVESADFGLDLNFDSLDIMNLIVAVEKEFGIAIHEHEIGDLKTVGHLIDFVKLKVG